jgi:type IV pilus assembly protein PilC
MPKFEYTAVDKTGKRLTGIIETGDVSQAAHALQAKNLRVVNIHAAKAGAVKSLPGFLGPKKVKLKDLVVFTRQLATMINAGVPLVRSLATLQTQTENKNFQKHIAEITKDIEGGMPFADSLAKHPTVFSPIYINMVRAGEAGGILDDILKKLAEQQEKDSKIRGKFKSAMTYPVILLTITGGVFMALMVFVMPKIGAIIKDLAGPNAELPALTKFMLGISDFMVHKWFILFPALIAGGYFLRRYVKTPKGRRQKDILLLKLPVLSMIIRKVAIARFARTFASLLTAGVTVIEAIEVTGKAIGNSVIEDELLAASKAVANGQQLSVPLANSKVFPPIVSQMMAIGEETGQTDQILVKVADFYEEEVDATVDSMSSILEPIMIVVMGAMVGLIVASVIGPITNLSNQI